MTHPLTRRTPKRKVTTTVVGVECTAQQELISRYCREGMAVQLLREPSNSTIAVWVEYRTLTDCGAGRIGYLSTDITAQLAPPLDAGGRARATIRNVTRGKKGKAQRGVNLHVEVG